MPPPPSLQAWSGARRVPSWVRLSSVPPTAVTSGSVAGQATAHPELRIELTGPWPPYSFAGPDDDDDGDER